MNLPPTYELYVSGVSVRIEKSARVGIIAEVLAQAQKAIPIAITAVSYLRLSAIFLFGAEKLRAPRLHYKMLIHWLKQKAKIELEVA